MGSEGNESKKTSADSLRNSLYEQYRHEIDGLWRNSNFAWAFEGLLFAAYGVIAKDFFSCFQIKTEILTYVVISAIALLGLCTSAVWIALTKASKTWQEWQEVRIVNLESDRDLFPYPRAFAMGGSENRIANVDNSLRTMKSGLFSPGRINIFVSQFVWFIWLVLFVAQQFSMWDKPRLWLVSVCFLFFYIAFVVIFKKKTCNKYITAEDYKESFILETYVRIEKSEKHLADVSQTPNKDKLYDYVINDYSALGWNLYSIWHTQGRSDDFSEWLTCSF